MLFSFAGEPMPEDCAQRAIRALAEVARTGPSTRELDIIRARLLFRILRESAAAGGPRGKAGALAFATMVHGTPAAHNSRLECLEALSVEDVKRCAANLQSSGPWTVRLRGEVRR
jgi:hypothetical protein